MTRLHQCARDRLRDIPSGCIDDDHPVVRRQQPEQSLQPFALAPDGDDPEPQIAAIERAEVLVVAPGHEAQGPRDVPTDVGGRASRQGHGRRAAQTRARRAEGPVARPKVMTPLGDTVGFVDGEQ